MGYISDIRKKTKARQVDTERYSFCEICDGEKGHIHFKPAKIRVR